MRVLYIDVDSMGPTHMSCYGYERETTPNIDKIAQESVCFTNMHTSDAPCLPSRTALITGQFGINTGVVDHGGKYADLRPLNEERSFTHYLNEDGLFALFKRNNMRTTLISSFADRHSAFWFNAGFNEIYNYGNSAEQQAPEIYDLTKKWLTNNEGEDDWFLYVNLWDPHTPYRVPADYENPFSDDEPYWINEEILEEHIKMTGPHTAKHLNMYDDHNHHNKEYFRAIGKIDNMDDMRIVRDGYDLGIHYADHHIGKIVNILKEQGIYEDTIIVVSADHGENMGELGIYSEHGTADKFTTNIPFIVKPNKKIEKRMYDGLHYSLDICPTVCDLLDTKKTNPHTKYAGKSFYNLFKGEEVEQREYLVVSQMAHVCQRGVRLKDYMYIRTYHDGYHLHYDEEMLFDLVNDPHEQVNIAKDNPDILLLARSCLKQWYEERMIDMPSNYTDDPMYTIISNGGPFHANKEIKFYVDSLIKDGRIDDANALKKRHPRWFK